MSIFIKAVEKSAMIHHISPDKLTEGEWIAKDVVVEGKTIASTQDLGVSEQQIEQLRELQQLGKLKTVAIKIGMPFVPAFFLSFILTVLIGHSWLFILV